VIPRWFLLRLKSVEPARPGTMGKQDFYTQIDLDQQGSHVDERVGRRRAGRHGSVPRQARPVLERQVASFKSLVQKEAGWVHRV